jgi:hypothetical protein
MASSTANYSSTSAQVTNESTGKLVYIVSCIFRAPSSGSGTWMNKTFRTVEEASSHCITSYKGFLDLYELPERSKDYTFDWEYEVSPTLEMADKLFSPKKINEKLKNVRDSLLKSTYSDSFKLSPSHAVLFAPYDCDSRLVPFEIAIRQIYIPNTEA